MIGYIIGYTTLVLLGSILVVLCVRTIKFKPQPQTSVSQTSVEIDANKAAQDFAEMLRCKTISHADASLDDDSEFLKFEMLLPSLFPNVFRGCDYERLNPRALMFRWKGATAADPVVFMAHFDVVSVTEAEWSKPAFDGIIENGEIWGRGALDTKSTLFSVLSAAEARIIEGFVPERDYYFCFGGDEEVAGGGAPSIVDELEKRGIKPCMVLDEGGAIVDNVFPGVTKPCALIGIGEKGNWNLQLKAVSKGGHASAPPADSPIDILALACRKIHDNPFKFRITMPAKLMLNNLAPYSTVLYKLIFSNLWLFKPVLNLITKKQGGELNAMMRTTVAFTMTEGSQGANVLPSSASLIMNLRLLEGDSKESALARIKRLVKNDAIEYIPLVGSEPSRSSPIDSIGYIAIERAIKESFPDVLVSPYLMIAGSDSRHYLRICDNVYRFSGMALSLEERGMIHGKDERIPVEKLADTIKFYYRLIGILQYI
ncbi:MAG: M20/M25/M40 family metallo-hydrolase [Oscillospiraceae bacterium]|nr:M20/M25/M40 family metallo-hydrolase [Oscillospiraceae bacterium]